MSKTTSLLSALLCTFIWGTTFIAQDTGMDNIGPFTFNAVRFFIGFLAITPLVFLFELKMLVVMVSINFSCISYILVAVQRNSSLFSFTFIIPGQTHIHKFLFLGLT